MSSSSDLSLKDIKDLLQQANEEVEAAHDNYALKSSGHKAALQIMQFEKDLFYGSSATGRHLQKIREIIEINAEDIVNENN